jgi:hypothetical protein
VRVLPTLLISMPSVVMPTLSSGCSHIPRSIMSAEILKLQTFMCMRAHKTVGLLIYAHNYYFDGFSQIFNFSYKKRPKRENNR